MKYILFRAWDKKKEIWYSGENRMGPMIYSADFEYSLPPEYDSSLYELAIFFKHLNEAADGNDRFILMQCTGLKDTKGESIYEYDIVSFMNENLVVEFHDAHFMIVDPKIKMHEDLWKALERGEIKVIGNIYENPELLKEKGERKK